MSTPEEVWGGFALDPRDPGAARLRAADADRDVIHRVLSDAFADGRLDREEYDERSASALQARTLGELPPLISDLVPERSPARRSSRASLVDASTADLQRRAAERWQEHRRHALIGFIGPSLICWAVWLATSWDDGDFDASFPWPLIVMAATLVNLVRTVISKDEMIRDEVRRLEDKQARLRRKLGPPHAEGR